MTEPGQASLEMLQQRMAARFVSGGPGVAISGAVWIVAGLVTLKYGIVSGFAILFVGGMLIHPLSLLALRVIGSASRSHIANPLERLALEGTAILFAGLLLAWLLLPQEPLFVFPIVALSIGVRYFQFRTLYNEPLYWMLGGAIAAIGTGGVLHYLPETAVLIAVGVVELGFAAAIIWRWRLTQ